MKKILGLLLALCLIAGCTSAFAAGIPAEQVKVGYICHR